jgi:hypothetical protein
MTVAFIAMGNCQTTVLILFQLSCISSIQLHFVMASGALHRHRFVCPLETGDPVAKVNPCVIAVVADRKAAGKLHALILEIHGYEHQLNAA